MEITTEFLKSLKACQEGIVWVSKYQNKNHNAVIEQLIIDDKVDWANWLLVRLMDYRQRVKYAIFAAEQVIHFFEVKYPNDKRPREAIEAAKKCLHNPSPKNQNTAAAAAAAAVYAAAAAYTSAAAVYAASGAYTAAASASAAVYAAAGAYTSYAAVYAASGAYTAAASASASYAAVYTSAAAAASAETRKKILDYGLELLSEIKL